MEINIKDFISFPLAVKMKSLGFDQLNSIIYFINNGIDSGYITKDLVTIEEHTTTKGIYAAYSIRELGEMIRKLIQNQGKNGNKFFMECIDFEHCCWSENEADQRALLLIMLKEKYPKLKV